MEDREEETVFSVWVNWKHRVISFTYENEFEELQYATHEEMFRFVIEKGNEGFGIPERRNLPLFDFIPGLM